MVAALVAWKRYFVWLAVGTAVTVSLGGCSLSRGIKFTNVSDTWLNVWFYVAATDRPADDKSELYRQRAAQVKPGDSASFRPPRNLVHIQVETVTPTWEPTGAQYWLELLTYPPIHIVAAGRDEKLDFKSFSGQIAIIPQRQLSEGRFDHLIPEDLSELSNAGGEP